MNDTERCANCRTTVGLAARSARGFWDENGTHLGSLCPNCVFYPERVSHDRRTLGNANALATPRDRQTTRFES